MIEKDILASLSEIPMDNQLRSIKGLGPIFIAAILSCAGDLRKYAHGRKLLRKAGLNLAERMSGKFKGQIILSKRGDATLRKYMYLAMITLIGTNPVFRRLHENNVQIKQMKNSSRYLNCLENWDESSSALFKARNPFHLKKLLPISRKLPKTY
jgi:transposase